VMLGGPGGGSTSQLSNFAWSRFCMSDNLGNWVGEILHQTNLCDLPDFFDFAGQYPSGENMGPFDQEAGYLATHLSAWTKRAVGWLAPSTVALHLGRVAEYTLHSISLIQPPPTGRIAAVQVGDQVPYLMVEARLQADQFDISIPNEGVIIYRVQTTDPLGNAQNDNAPLALLTKIALTAGQSFTTEGVTVQVGSSVPGGFSIQVSTSNPIGMVPDVIEMTASIASRIITNAGFIPRFSVSKGLWVSSQSPTGGSIAPFGSTVTMTLHGGPMP
jgi:PASTA domain